MYKRQSTWADLPHKFEAGTPAIAEAIGLAEAINYINTIGLNEINEYEKTITKYLFEKLNQIENIETKELVMQKSQEFLKNALNI